MTQVKQWPEKRDSPTVKARKVALAYRQAAAGWEEMALALKAALSTIDRKLIAFDSIATLKMIDEAAARQSTIRSVGTLDALFIKWGETWHCPQPISFDDSDYVDAKTAAGLIQLATGTLHRYRVEGRIPATWVQTNGARGYWMFKVGELYDFAKRRPRRGDNFRNRKAAST